MSLTPTLQVFIFIPNVTNVPVAALKGECNF